MRPQTCAVVAKRVEHGANVIVPTITGCGDAGQFKLEPAQLRDPAPQVNQLPFGNLVRPVQIRSARAFQRQQRFDVGQGKAEITPVANEPKAVQGGFSISPLVSRRSVRLGQQASLLVEPNCGHLYTRAAGQLSDRVHFWQFTP